VNEILAMERPRGIFGNPNVSMLQVNIIFLFVVLARRHGLVPRTSMPVNVAIVALPAMLSVVLQSRGELLSSALISAVFIDTLMRERGRAVGQKAIVVVGLILTMIVVVKLLTVYAANSALLAAGLARVTRLGSASGPTPDLDSSFLRPLLAWGIVYNRFLASPIFGSGFNVSDAFPFDYSPTYFHNDWFRVLVTSGTIGLGLLFALVRRFFAPLGLIALLPFVFPGLTNTFLLAVPSVMFYFFMVGVLRERLRARASAESIAAERLWPQSVGDSIPVPG
jgi:O-antigen ligase